MPASAGVAGMIALVAALVLRSPAGIGVAAGALGAGYALRLVLDDPPLDGRAAVFAGGLLLMTELAFWSVELRLEVAREPGRHARRLALELGLALGGALLAALVLSAADLAQLGGIGIEVAGALAATALLWLARTGLRGG